MSTVDQSPMKAVYAGCHAVQALLLALLVVAGLNPVLADPGKSVTTGGGETLALSMQELADSRGYIYCEIVFIYEGDFGSDIYSTSPLAPCSVEWWDNLDMKALAEERGAKVAVKNGPQWWSMDSVGAILSEPVTIGGVEMVWGARLPAGTMQIPHYTVFSPAKTQNLTWKAGQPTYRIIDAEGYHYVLQGHKVPTERLAGLGDDFEGLPEGWSYQVIVPEEDLVMHLTPAKPIPSVQDEFDQIYIRIPN